MTYPASFRLLVQPTAPDFGTDALGPYAETYWLPMLRPAAYLLARRLVILAGRGQVTEGKVLMLNSVDLALALGLTNQRMDDQTPGLAVFNRALHRLEKYHLAQWQGANLAVRLRWRRLTSGLLASLPDAMQHAEPDWWALAGSQSPEFVER